MKSFGGYLDLQLNRGEEFYPDLIKLNTGRNALEYILKVKKYKMVYIPYFTCKAVLEPIRKLKLAYEFYTIDEHLDPVIDFSVGAEECFIYTNYFGVKQQTAEKLAAQFNCMIQDNSQAFYAPPLPGVETFYSCRKFFGVPDGAYLKTSSPVRLKMEKDVSYDRCAHLLKSIDLGIESGFDDYRAIEESLSGNPIRKMSTLTQHILANVDYKFCRFRRNSNFLYLHEHLETYNDFWFDASRVDGPMIYPLVIKNSDFKARLLLQKVFVPTFWPNVLEWTTPKMFEHYLTSNLVALPVDQRYTHSDMKRIVKLVKACL